MSAKLHRRSSSADNLSTDDEYPHPKLTRSYSRKNTKTNLNKCIDFSQSSESEKEEPEEDFIYSEITPTLPTDIKRKSLGVVNKKVVGNGLKETSDDLVMTAMTNSTQDDLEVIAPSKSSKFNKIQQGDERQQFLSKLKTVAQRNKKDKTSETESRQNLVRPFTDFSENPSKMAKLQDSPNRLQKAYALNQLSEMRIKARNQKTGNFKLAHEPSQFLNFVDDEVLQSRPRTQQVKKPTAAEIDIQPLQAKPFVFGKKQFINKNRLNRNIS